MSNLVAAKAITPDPSHADDVAFISKLANEIMNDHKKKKSKKNRSQSYGVGLDNVFSERLDFSKPIIKPKKLKKLGPREIGKVNENEWKPSNYSNVEDNNKFLDDSWSIKKTKSTEKLLIKKPGPREIGKVNEKEWKAAEYNIEQDNSHFLSEKMNKKIYKNINHYCDKTCHCSLHYKPGPIEIGTIDYQPETKQIKKISHKKTTSVPTLLMHEKINIDDKDDEFDDYFTSMNNMRKQLEMLEKDDFSAQFSTNNADKVEDKKNKDELDDIIAKENEKDKTFVLGKLDDL